MWDRSEWMGSSGGTDQAGWGLVVGQSMILGELVVRQIKLDGAGGGTECGAWGTWWWDRSCWMRLVVEKSMVQGKLVVGQIMLDGASGWTDHCAGGAGGGTELGGGGAGGGFVERLAGEG